MCKNGNMSISDNIVLHQFPVSPFAAKVRRVLHYKAIPYTTVDYSLTSVRRIKKISKSGKLPVLVHKGNRLEDSTDIVRYIDTTFSAHPLGFTDSTINAQVHILEDWADESLYFYDLTMRGWENNINLLASDLVLQRTGLLAFVARLFLPRMIKKTTCAQGLGRKSRAVIIEDFQKSINALNNLLGDKKWLVGTEISLADISVTAMLCVLERAEEAKHILGEFPNVCLWIDRVDQLTLPKGTCREARVFA